MNTVRELAQMSREQSKASWVTALIPKLNAVRAAHTVRLAPGTMGGDVGFGAL